MTYSIVARDAASGLLGIGIQSHFFAAGSIASFAEPGVGVIATQAFASRQYGPLGMELLSAGMSSAVVLDSLLRMDQHYELRQIGIVDSQGRASAFTGGRCVQYASHCTAEGVSAQGNMLAAPQIPEAMVDAYRSARGDLAERILAALDAAEAKGGDARGKQAASLLIVGATRDGRPWDSVLHDERVDDSAAPLIELRRLVRLRKAYRKIGRVIFEEGPLFGDPHATDRRELEGALVALAASEREMGDDHYEATLWRAILLARHGQSDEALRLMKPLLQREPKLARFINGLVAARILDAAVADALTAAGSSAP